METPNTSVQPEPLALKEVAALLLRHYNLHEGHWDLAIEMKVAIGALGATPDSALPGAMIGVSRIGLVKVEKAGPLSVNASELNPKL